MGPSSEPWAELADGPAPAAPAPRRRRWLPDFTGVGGGAHADAHNQTPILKRLETFEKTKQKEFQQLADWECESVHWPMLQYADFTWTDWLSELLLPGEEVQSVGAPPKPFVQTAFNTPTPRDRRVEEASDFVKRHSTAATVHFHNTLDEADKMPARTKARSSNPAEDVPAILPCRYAMATEVSDRDVFRDAFLVVTNLRVMLISHHRQAIQEALLERRVDNVHSSQFGKVKSELNREITAISAMSGLTEDTFAHAVPLHTLNSASLRFEMVSISVTRAEYALRYLFCLTMFALGLFLIIIGSLAVPVRKVYLIYIILGIAQFLLSLLWFCLTIYIMVSFDTEAAVAQIEHVAGVFKLLLPTSGIDYRSLIDTIAGVNFGTAVLATMIDQIQLQYPDGLPAVPPADPVPAQTSNWIIMAVSLATIIFPRLEWAVAIGGRISQVFCYARCCVRSGHKMEGVELKRFIEVTEETDVQLGKFKQAKVANIRWRRRILAVDYDIEKPVVQRFGVSNKDGGEVSGQVQSTAAKLYLNVFEDVHPLVVARVMRTLQQQTLQNNLARHQQLLLTPHLGIINAAQTSLAAQTARTVQIKS
jgi:hypothetical protein